MYYVLKSLGTIDGIDGELVTVEKHNLQNGDPLLDGELMRSREPIDADNKLWRGGELVNMTQDEMDIITANYAALAQAVRDARPTRTLEQLILLKLQELDQLIGSSYAGATPFNKGVNVSIANAIETFVNNATSDQDKIDALKLGARLSNLMANINAMDPAALCTNYFGK